MMGERRRFWALMVSGAVLCALTMAGFYELQCGETETFVIVALVQGAFYLVAAQLVWRGGLPRHALPIILILATVMRITILWAPPYLSTDIYRYVWDGRVTAHGINPYRYIPADPQLNTLRDETIFPKVNRSTYAPTIYPPVAETIFFAVTRFGETVFVMKAAMVALEALAVLLLLRVLSLAALPRERILLYAWHPLALWEFAGSGHIDAAVIAFVALALWARQRGRMGIAGIAIAAAGLVKFFPLVVAPALYRRWDWKMPVAIVVSAVVAYLPFLGAGWKVLGFLSGYAYEEGFNQSGAGYYFWTLAKLVLPLDGVSAFPYAVGALVILAALALPMVFSRERAEDRVIANCAILATAFVALLSPHYPWYFAWLITFSCFVRYHSLRYLTLASFLLYLVPVGSLLVVDDRRLLAESAIYGPFAILVLCDLWLRKRRSLDRS